MMVEGVVRSQNKQTLFIAFALLFAFACIRSCQSQNIVVERLVTGDTVSNLGDCKRFHGEASNTGLCGCTKGTFFTSCLNSTQVQFHTGMW